MTNAPKSVIKPLEEVLAYKNENVVARFCQIRPDAKEEVSLIFDDLKRFLWLVATLEERKKQGEITPDISFSASTIIMDDMWHAFILWTKQYEEFCQTYLGNFVHHPTEMPIYQKNTTEKNLDEEAAMNIFLEGMITVCIEELGEEVTQRWFDYYLKYPASGMH